MKLYSHLSRRRMLGAFLLGLVLTFLFFTNTVAQDVTSNAKEVNGVPTNLFMWAALVGFLASPVISMINRARWSSEMKAISAFLWCTVGSFGTVLFSDQFDAKNLATTVLLVLFTATGSYKAFWQPSGIAGRIEQKTG